VGGVISRPYSDFALYHLGVGQRLFFMHDGRTADLLQAILDHQSDHGSEHGAGCDRQRSSAADANNRQSEADAVIRNFKLLSASQVQDLLNFLRSL
jgi:hypothetical protein